jgi:hypothetical protein
MHRALILAATFVVLREKIEELERVSHEAG